MRIAAALTLLILAMMAASAVVPAATDGVALPFAVAIHAV
jgi:hypothetical protein